MLLNAYATLAEFRALPEIKSEDPEDDEFIEDLLNRASRDGVDAYCEQSFYASTQTRTFDLPRGRRLYVDMPLISVTTLVNGDGNTIPASEFYLWPYNSPNHSYLELYPVSIYYWLPSLTKLDRGVVSITGTWGYVDRTATDPESLRVISATKSACLAIALSAYKKRYGVGVDGIAKVTAAGVVITPQGIPSDAKQRLESLRSYL